MGYQLQLPFSVEDNGVWNGKVAHQFDEPLAEGLSQFFLGKTVADFGCGHEGYYTKYLKSKGVTTIGFDGNPYTKHPLIIADLSKPLILGGKLDWVLCLELGEHIPEKYESALLHNCVSNSAEGIVMSWAIPGQNGRGHVNCRSNEYVKEKLDLLGYDNDEDTQSELRSASTLPWFKNTLMVFNKRSVNEKVFSGT